MRRRKLIRYTGLGLALSVSGCIGGGNGDGDGNGDYPQQTIRKIVPWGEGGGTDTYARKLAPPLEKEIGGDIQVENLPGAGSMRANVETAHSEPDGYTYLHASPPGQGIPGTLVDEDWDAMVDHSELEPVTQFARTVYVVMANPDLGIEDYDDLVDRFQNGDLSTIGSMDPGTVVSLVALGIRSGHGVEWEEHVAYDGAGQTNQAVASGEVPVGVASDVGTQAFAEDDQVDTIAVAHSAGSDVFPDIDTVTEAGYDNIDPVSATTRGLVAPPDTPVEYLDAMDSAMEAVTQSDEIQSWSEETGNNITYGDRETFAAAWEGATKHMDQHIDKEQLAELMGVN